MVLATSTTATAPWWWVAALAGLFTTLGALVSLFSNWIVKRGELRRLDRIRWDDKVLTISAALLAMADRLWRDFQPTEPDVDKQIAFLAKYRIELEAAREQAKGLDLIAPQELCDAATGLTNAIGHFLLGAATDLEHTRALEVWRARDNLRDEARKTLNAID